MKQFFYFFFKQLGNRLCHFLVCTLEEGMRIEFCEFALRGWRDDVYEVYEECCLFSN